MKKFKINALTIYGIIGFFFGLSVLCVCIGVFYVNLPRMEDLGDEYDPEPTDAFLFDEEFPFDIDWGSTFLRVGCMFAVLGSLVQFLTPILIIFKWYRPYILMQATVVPLLVMSLVLPLYGMTSDVREVFFDSIDPEIMKDNSLLIGAMFIYLIAADLIYILTFLAVYVMYWSNHNLKGHPSLFVESY